MNYEKAYKAVLQTAKQWIKDGCTDKEKICLECVFPELRESEDERIRKALIDIFSSINKKDWRGIPSERILAWLEKQKINTDGDFARGYDCGYECCLNSHGAEWLEKKKEQKPVEPSDEELQRHQDELYDFKVFATKQAKEHHISHVHDFEWHNFCAELLSYFSENQKPAEWSEEDEEVMEDLYNFVISDFIQDHIHETRWKPWKTTLERNRQNRLKSIRPSWKPSEEQMDALKELIDDANRAGWVTPGATELYEQLKKL